MLAIAAHQGRRFRFSLPVAIVAVVAAIAAVPLLSVGANLIAGGTSETWRHLAGTVLPEYIANTLLLAGGVAVGVIVIGVGTAWLTVMLDFPGRRLFEWALILPLAMPSYVMAYVYTDLLQFVGPVQTSLREYFGWAKADYWFPEIRSLGGAVAMLTLALYPYVYLLARTAFIERAVGVLEAGRSLGYGPWGCFLRLSLPLARPAVAAGTALVLMETLADYGTVAYFAVPTFTTGIYRAWFALGDRVAAAQLAGLLLIFVALALLAERRSRGRARFHNTTHRDRPPAAQRLGRAARLAATAACAFPLATGFLVPAIILLRLAWSEGDAQFGTRFIELSRNSLLLAALTAAIGVLLAVALAYAARTTRSGVVVLLNRALGLGYAVPGSVIAVGVLIPLLRFDNWIAEAIRAATGASPGLLLTGGIAALIYAYLVRFLAIALQTVEASLAKITAHMDDAARSLGLAPRSTLWRVHLPLLRPGMLTAALLVFVDVMKELPATLVMRPFNFDTLATQTFILASDERLAEASTAALAIVGVGLIPLVVLARQVAHRPGRQAIY